MHRGGDVPLLLFLMGCCPELSGRSPSLTIAEPPEGELLILVLAADGEELWSCSFIDQSPQFGCETDDGTYTYGYNESEDGTIQDEAWHFDWGDKALGQTVEVWSGEALLLEQDMLWVENEYGTRVFTVCETEIWLEARVDLSDL
jgi:hypothetical protein